jgi:Ca2+-binding EF-hand superfamily protein
MFLVSLSFCILHSAFCIGAKPTDPGAAEDVQDVLFFSESQPVLIRLHLFVDGKPHSARWTAYLTRWFRFLDRDEDGFLDRTEAARAPSALILRELFSNPYTYNFTAAPSFDDFDRDRDKKVSLAEFLRYYRETEAGPMQLAQTFNQSIQGVQQDIVTDALYNLLDTDKDGKLSWDELIAAEKTLRKCDQDDDELLAVEEVLPAPGATNSARPLVPAMQAPSMPLMLVPREDAPRQIVARLRVAKAVLEHYDKNKNRSLSRDEIGMPRELFDRLDADKDGELNTLELLRWVIAKPDAEAVLRLGRVEGKLDPIEPAGGKNAALRKMASNTLSFSTADYCINLIAARTVQPQAVQSMRQILVRQFKTVDQKEKGYLTKKQLATPQLTYLRNILTAADLDEDDCLSLEELNAWVDLTASGLQCQTSVALAASGRGLFQILDVNQDGRLSIRELRNTQTRLAPYDRDGDRAISRTEIPLQYQVVVNPGVPNYLAGQLSGFRPPGTPPPAALSQGPLWFRKMDRNGDGDISPREFLGTHEDFRRLDADGDGLISLEEARRADAALRKK